MCLPISWWVIYEHTCPHHTECSAVFDQKTSMTPMAHPPYSPDLALNIFLFPWMKQILEGKYFANVEEVKQEEMAEALKDIKINILISGKKCLDRCIASNRECFGGD